MFRFHKGIIGVLVLLIIATFSVSAAIGGALDLSLEDNYIGTAINNTTFANISSAEPCSAMLPGAAIQNTEDSISMAQNTYGESELANLTEAVDSALSFMDQFEYISSMNFTLDETYSKRSSLKWTLRFLSPEADIYVGVNAYTRCVASYHASWNYWYSPSPYVRELNSSILSIRDIELATLQFLERNNLTLSEYSRYIPATIEYAIRYITNNVYVVRFFEVINSTLVEGNEVTLYFDVLTGDVVSYRYHWVFIHKIPVHGIIGKVFGEQYASNYINQYSTDLDYRITKTVLLFRDFGSYNSFSYILCWAVYTDHSRYAAVFVNAKNGEIITTSQSMTASSFLDNTRLDFLSLLLPFVFSTSLAILAYSLTKRLSLTNLKMNGPIN